VLPYSRELFCVCRDGWEQEADPVKMAAMWFVVARQSFSGRFGNSWSFAVNHSRCGMSAVVSKWISVIELLPKIHERLQRVQIEYGDFRKIYSTYDTPETLFYADPPYVGGTRRNGGYKYEMTDDDHRDHVEILLGLEGRAMVSGYRHPIYERLEEHGWRRLDWDVACSAAGRTRGTGLQGAGVCEANQRRTECLWISPSCDRADRAGQGVLPLNTSHPWDGEEGK